LAIYFLQRLVYESKHLWQSLFHLIA
jgi:hypothetical protein